MRADRRAAVPHRQVHRVHRGGHPAAVARVGHRLLPRTAEGGHRRVRSARRLGHTLTEICGLGMYTTVCISLELF